jgi:membrane associated rhomboid family serine protease
MGVRRCPHDGTLLERRWIRKVELDVCPDCRGVFLDRGELERLLPGFHSADMRAVRRTVHHRANGLTCPPCKKPMLRLRYGPVATTFVLDRCVSCGGLWLDRGEVEGMLEASDRVRRVNQKKIFTSKRRFGGDPLDEEVWAGEAAVSCLLGVPVEIDRSCRVNPWATYGILAACVLAALVTFFLADAGEVFRRWGMVPACILEGRRLFTLVTSMFLHGGLFHLLGNGYFLYVFGDNVEERLGVKRFVLYYLLLGILAGLTSALLTHYDPRVPHIGASGAIAGLMGTYLVLYPHSQFVIVLRYVPLRIPAWGYLVFWVLYQGFLLTQNVNVDVYAHLGGFAAGIVGGIVIARQGRARAAETTSRSRSAGS